MQQLNSNATPLRICPHFVLICFLPIWPSLWKPLYISMQPVSAFFQAVFTGCLVTKSKTGRVSKLTDFLLLCVLKSIFFYRKGSPPRMVEIHGKWSRLSNTDSNHFGKLGCKRTYIEYGSDTGFHQRKREVPLFKSYSRKQNSRMRKNKKTTWCLVTKIKNWQGLQIDRFLITLCTKK